MVKKRTKQGKKIERQLIKIALFVVALVLLFVVANSFFNFYFKKINQIEYEGLIFTKEKFGDIPVFRYYYYLKIPASENVIQYNFYLRNDPRTNEIPVINPEDIVFDVGKVFVTLDPPNLAQCTTSQLAVGDLTSFLTDNQFKVTAGSLDFVRAPVYNLPYVTCETNPNDSVIQLIRGDQTEIIAEDNCFSIVIGPSCDIAPAVEKFKTQSIINAREKAGLN